MKENPFPLGTGCVLTDNEKSLPFEGRASIECCRTGVIKPAKVFSPLKTPEKKASPAFAGPGVIEYKYPEGRELSRWTYGRVG
ncbi:MAG: hypothetical protein CVU64_11615 [Deltaproteobacteria bacterium HGW-Deltaproteobacteria-21]|nr:MAG: hypothetical protein CVU64_11615 [Deltaproteobacteria bacterium HGW-Deltaproteobacteria-21]